MDPKVWERTSKLGTNDNLDEQANQQNITHEIEHTKETKKS